MKYWLLLPVLLFTLLSSMVQGQGKKILDHPDFAIWNIIASQILAPDGSAVLYRLVPGEGDASLNIYEGSSGETRMFPRASAAYWSSDSRYVAFKISPAKDSLKAMRRRKVKKADLPKDSLAIYSMSGELVKIPEVKSFVLPEKWSGWLAYQLNPAKKDSTNKHLKKEDKENGSRLVLRNLESGKEDTLGYVTQFVAAKESGGFLASSTGDKRGLEAGVYYFDPTTGSFQPIFAQKGKYTQLVFDDNGTQAAFLADLDTTKAKIRYPGLAYWKKGDDQARMVVDQSLESMPENWRISPDAKPYFSENGKRLFFGLGKEPILQDTSALEEEIVQVEVWTWQDAELYPQQKVRKDREKKRSYLTAWDVESESLAPLARADIPNVVLGAEGNASVFLGFNDRPYLRSISWEGSPSRKDVFLIDPQTGEAKQTHTALRATPRLSPTAIYMHWYHRGDSTHVFYRISDGQSFTLAADEDHPWYDEENDRPLDAPSYGQAGWLENDAEVFLYDRYDIWRVDPAGGKEPIRLTRGREKKVSYRYIKVDPEERFFQSDQKLLLAFFDEKTKGSGYASLDLSSGKVEELMSSPDHLFTRGVRKAKNAEVYLYTKESTADFPDLYLSSDMKTGKRISEANPQQSEYNWATKELFEWIDPEGITRQGLVIKPADFDPKKKYPAIVYFYERSSQNLNRHYRPYPVRSIINFTFYASRGYVIFIPDIWYKVGYPGKSAFDAVMSGTLALLEEGYVDRDRLGIQGHSWGGYQDAYIITQTDLFKCAESGAPVVNMTSAYGGIRWGSGMSRMFQYEHTQSRIGGTLWEYPMRYLENSPLFYLDKVNTPVLILHNDEDGAVPWYQGIEFFVGLRRLGKPAWLLNYNGEPHWPVKLQNRKDFQKRMQQFFDYYLMDAPKPRWMERGVPALEKGIEQGYELMKE